MYATHMLRLGRTYDIEDSRATDRLNGAYAVLKALGAEPTIVHGPQVGWDWATGRERHIEACTLHGTGVAGCTITWPAWVTDEMLEAAYGMADTFRTARGGYNRAAVREASLATQGERHDKCGRMVAFGELHWTDECRAK